MPVEPSATGSLGHDRSRETRRCLAGDASAARAARGAGVAVDPFYEREGGLAFDLLSSYSGQQRVTIGHADGVITIDLIETLDDYRAAMRIRLREPYRTMLGHVRHGVGHYYQWILVEQTDWITECRELFGDERASYSNAIDRHHRQGAPEGWEASCTDSFTTAAAGGLVLQASRVDGLIDADIVPRTSYQDATTSEMPADWQWLSLLLNRVNHAMGRKDM